MTVAERGPSPKLISIPGVCFVISSIQGRHQFHHESNRHSYNLLHAKCHEYRGKLLEAARLEWTVECEDGKG